MSYYSTLQIGVFALDDFDFDTLSNKILGQLQEDGIHEDVLQDIRAAFAGEQALVKVVGAYLVSLIDFIHHCVPHLEFDARGWGEEFGDIWMRSYRANSNVFSVGPFDLGIPKSEQAFQERWFTPTAEGVAGWRAVVRPAWLKRLLIAILLAIIIFTFSRL